MTEPRVVLYVGPGCGLCSEARTLLSSAGIAFEEAEESRYVLRVPVVEIDGQIVSEGRISMLAIRHALRKAARRPPRSDSL